MRISTILAALLVTTAAAAPALAGSPDLAVRRVQISDLDLSTPGGQSALRYRIGRAIEGVCGSYATVAEPVVQDEITACRVQAKAGIDRAVAARKSSVAVATR